MKKLLNIIFPTVIMTSFSVFAISCSLENTTSRQFLDQFKDFDWSDEDMGDGLNFKYDENNPIDQQFMIDNLEKQKITQSKVDYIWDYETNSTGYQRSQYLKKQGVTGVPTNKAYMPTGNALSDFGIGSKANKYTRINKLNTWDTLDDNDLEYNSSSTAIKGRNFVASKEVQSQQQDVFFNAYHQHVRNQGTFNNTIVGTKNPYGDGYNNLQYVHEFIDWAGMTDEGFVTPPAADLVENCHRNGIPVYGVIFLDGWQNLTKEMITEMLDQNDNGHFKLVDRLIKMCQTMGFDGWFINNEGNGSQPNGTIVDYNDINKVFQQFNEIVDKSTNREINKLKLIWYRNMDSVKKTLSYWESTETIEMAKNARELQLDFYTQKPGDENEFIKYKEKFGEKDWRKKLYSFFYLEQKPGSIGNLDYRKFIYETDKNSKYKDNPSTGFSLFENDGSGLYAKEYANKAIDKNTSDEEKSNIWLKAQEINNLYNDFQFSGSNGYLSDQDNGTKIEDGWTSKINIIDHDPRLMQKQVSKEKIDDEYSFDANYNETSFGLGNIFSPYTTITDTKIGNDDNKNSINEVQNTPDISTNFSTGSGVKFLDRDNDGQLLEEDSYYPWTNLRIADVQPTYQWDFWSTSQNDNTRAIEDQNGNVKNRSLITENGQLNGYFDYNDPYKKGNSIAIANGYDINGDGKLIKGKWGEGPYKWNIMGTNLQKDNYTVSFVVKSTNNDAISAAKDKTIDEIAKNTNITVTMSDNSVKTIIPTVKKESDGWYKLSLNLANQDFNVNSENRISKFGLTINPNNKTNFIFNVGQFSLDTNKNKNLETNLDLSQNENVITKVNSNYIIKRKDATKNNINLRLNWETTNLDGIDYYEMYLFIDQKWFKIGETTQQEYYLRELSEYDNNKIKLGIKMVGKNQTNRIFAFDFDTTYNYKDSGEIE